MFSKGGTDMTQPQDQDWHEKLKAQMEALRKLQLANQVERQRQANREVLEWMETQPPEIKDISIGK